MDKNNFNVGFTQVPHKIGNILPLLGLNGRQYRVISLIIRLTYGCQKRWAKLKLADLKVVGIAPPHARAVIEPLISKNIIIQNGKTKEYRLNEEYLSSEVTERVNPELEKLRILVGRQLKKENYQNTNQEIAKSVTEALPKEENLGYQSGNDERLLDRVVVYTKEGGFLDEKDTLNKKINKDIDNDYIDEDTSKERSGQARRVNPESFAPRNETEYAAKNAWEQLEPDHPDSFGFYLWAVKQGLPASKFFEFTSEIRSDFHIKNKGAFFVLRVKSYLKRNV